MRRRSSSSRTSGRLARSLIRRFWSGPERRRCFKSVLPSLNHEMPRQQQSAVDTATWQFNLFRGSQVRLFGHRGSSSAANDAGAVRREGGGPNHFLMPFSSDCRRRYLAGERREHAPVRPARCRQEPSRLGDRPRPHRERVQGDVHPLFWMSDAPAPPRVGGPPSGPIRKPALRNAVVAELRRTVWMQASCAPLGNGFSAPPCCECNASLACCAPQTQVHVGAVAHDRCPTLRR